MQIGLDVNVCIYPLKCFIKASFFFFFWTEIQFIRQPGIANECE